MPHKRRPGELASSGRGLMLMEMLADAWGVDPRGEGKSIWFELYESAGGRRRLPARRDREPGLRPRIPCAARRSPRTPRRDTGTASSMPSTPRRSRPR